MARIRTVGLVLAALIPISCFADLGEDLLAAVRKGDGERVKTLLDQGADVNSKSPYGATGLFFAAGRGNVEVIKILLDHGADVNVKDTFYGETALGWAVYKQRVEVIRVLISKGAKGADGVLMSGVRNKNIDMVRVALEHKSEIPEETLSQALQATKDSPEIVDLLKKSGVKPPVRPNFQVDAETLKSYTGTYSMEGLDVKFDLIEGKLTGGFVGDKAAPLDAIDQTTFQHSEYPTLKIKFDIQDGKVVSVTVHEGSEKPMVFTKTSAK